jgi:hypothetical protein
MAGTVFGWSPPVYKEAKRPLAESVAETLVGVDAATGQLFTHCDVYFDVASTLWLSGGIEYVLWAKLGGSRTPVFRRRGAVLPVQISTINGVGMFNGVGVSVRSVAPCQGFELEAKLDGLGITDVGRFQMVCWGGEAVEPLDQVVAGQYAFQTEGSETPTLRSLSTRVHVSDGPQRLLAVTAYNANAGPSGRCFILGWDTTLAVPPVLEQPSICIPVGPESQQTFGADYFRDGAIFRLGMWLAWSATALGFTAPAISTDLGIVRKRGYASCS